MPRQTLAVLLGIGELWRVSSRVNPPQVVLTLLNHRCAPFKSWQRVYSYDLTYELSKEEAKSVLGGEVALWSEQSDSMTLDMKLWPRAAAAAEMLWSGRYDSTGKQRDIGEAMPRMFDWRYRLVEP